LHVSKNSIVRISLALAIPNAFTPNGDGKNDHFRIPPGVALTLQEFSVYDRWGNKIFTTKNISEGWDGCYKNGAKAVPGVYVCTIRGMMQNKPFLLRGTIVLIR